MKLKILIPIVWTLLISLGSISPVNKDHVSSEMLDVGHIVSYAILSMLWIWTLRSSTKGFILALATTPLTEILQAFIPWRDANIIDLFNNAIGVTLGYSLLLSILWMKKH